MMQKTGYKNNNLGLYFILPAILGTFIFIIIPIFCSFCLSFTDWDLLGDIKFVGLDNYNSIFNEPIFKDILLNTFIYAISVTFFAVIIPLVIAAIINTKIKGSELFKTIYFIPFITPAVVIAILWGWVFDPNIGAVNTLLKTDLKWLFDTRLAMPVLIFVSVWKLVGYNVVLFLTGFTGINSNLYEAAKIDGAGIKETFFYVTVPLLKPTIYFVTLVTAISSFQVFDLIYVMTEYFDIGKSCALAYVLFTVIFVLVLLQRKIAKKD